MQNTALTVRQLNLYVRSLIEGDSRLVNILVEGELSNFKNHYSSGHLYFTLKDREASVRCVMFKVFAAKLNFQPEDGMRVVLRGRVSLYEKDGQYQFYAESMSVSGLGDIALQFRQVKLRLEAEGMLDPNNKRPLPKYPENIAVITSPTGAAVRDILNILSRRWPNARVIVCPVSVQGELAVPEMLDTLDRLYSLSCADVIIIGRGGGSAEDLWAFNNEALARKLYESPVPVISAVGHETDFTICDFVADLRAPTPSSAAELAVPDNEEILLRLNKYRSQLKAALILKKNLCKARLKSCLSNRYFRTPMDSFINKKHLELDRLSDRLVSVVNLEIKDSENRLISLASSLDSLSPLKVLSRGYAVVQRGDNSVTSVKEIGIGEDLNLRFYDGSVTCRVTEIKE